MNKNVLFNILLGGALVVTVSALSALGENRLDVYFSMFTLEYFVLVSLLRPRRRFKDVLAFTLLAIFSTIVGFKVAEVILI